MNQNEPALPWSYVSEDDVWISADGSLAIDGAYIRQLARQLLRARRGRVLSALESRYHDQPEIGAAYRQAVVDVLSGSFPLPLAS